MEYYNKEMECMSLSDKKELQSKRLIDTVQKVYDNVKTYREKMDKIGLKPSDIKGIDDIHKLPFTTKQDLRDNYPFGMFAADKRDIIRVHASSGTTGKLTVVGYTQYDIDMWAECCARALVSAGATHDSVVHIAYGYGLFTGGLGMHYGAERLGAIAVPVSSGNTARQLQLMKDFEADVLCCTPSYAIYIAEEMKKYGIKPEDMSLKYGIFGAEPWSKEMRDEIEDKLKLKAFDIYGLSEITGPGVAIECKYQCGSHIQDDFFYPEIVDEHTLEPLGYGKRGELVFTTLTKEGIPLIRYRTRDITALNNSPCKCGRTGIRIDRIAGRSDDMLIIRGVNVFPSQIESVLLKEKEIAPHYHITLDRVNNLDTMRIDIELAEGVAFDEVKKVESLTKRIANEINSAIGLNAEIRLVSSGSIERSMGKAKRVTDNRKF
ncbi:MAG: phenylacetate--CoA ligase [Bacillota bacterium]|jgi:phenylacetate-CoA ligase|nr:phenylacetate--CoA ligase [Bacillota bacterium]HHU43493.1 phenylacetate--CoA ligase [Clostridiales bacterium]